MGKDFYMCSTSYLVEGDERVSGKKYKAGRKIGFVEEKAHYHKGPEICLKSELQIIFPSMRWSGELKRPCELNKFKFFY